MNRKVFSLALLFISGSAIAQVGIGTVAPEASTILQLESPQVGFKGVLMPRVALKSTTDIASFSSGKVSNSLLVYNTTQNAYLTPGFYYWFTDRWIRMISNEDDILNNAVTNAFMGVDLVNKKLYLEDTAQNQVSIPLEDINIVTQIKKEPNGIYSYTNELNEVVLINIPLSVIQNIVTILNDTVVKDAIIMLIQSASKKIEGDSIISVTGGQKSVLNDVKLAVQDYSITNNKLAAAPNDINKVLTVGQDGKIHYALVDTKNTMIVEFRVDLGSDQLQIVDSDQRTLSVGLEEINILTNLVPVGNGVYEYTNELGQVTTIDVVADVINSINSILSNPNVKQQIMNLVLAQGQPIYSDDNSMVIRGGDKAVLASTTINIAPSGVTELKIADQAVSTVKIKDQAVTTDKIATESVTTLKIGNESVIATKIAPAAINQKHIAPGAVDIQRMNSIVASSNAAPNSVITADGKGGVYFKNIDKAIEDNAAELTVTAPLVVGGNADKALLKPVSLSLSEKGITTYHIADQAITQDKLGAPEDVAIGAIPMVQTDKSVKYASLEQIAIARAQDVTSKDGSITLTAEKGSIGGQNTVFQGVDLKLSDAAVTTTKIKDYNVTAEKLFGGEANANTVGVVQGDGTVKYQPILSTLLTSDVKVDNSLVFSGGTGVGAVLEGFQIGVNTNGIINTHIDNLAVTQNKISSGSAQSGAVLTAKGGGITSFEPLSAILTPTMNGSIVGDSESINVIGGKNVIYGPTGTVAKITLKVGGVKGENLSAGSVTSTKIGANQVSSTHIDTGAVIPSKLSAGIGPANRVAMADAAGDVNYLVLDTDVLGNKGTITTDGIIVSDVTDGVTLADVNLSIADAKITAAKLTAGVNATVGAVATVSDTNGAITYKSVTPNDITEKGTLYTDDIIQVGTESTTYSSSLSDAVLVDTHLSIKKKSIGTDQLSDYSVTIEKLSSEEQQADMILATDNKGGFKYVSGASLSNDGADLELDNDGILGFGSVSGAQTTGKDVVLEPTKIIVNDKSIPITKLKNTGAVNGQVLVTSGDAFALVSMDEVSANAQDLTLESSLKFTTGDGALSVLKPISIGINEKGVTTDKIGSSLGGKNADDNTILTADGSGGVTYQSAKDLIFTKGKPLSSDSTLLVSTNNALLEEATIAIAPNGVQNSHVSSRAITTDKIGSSLAGFNAKTDAILTADGFGGVMYQSADELIFTKGKAVTSAAGTISIGGGSGATLAPLQLDVNTNSITNEHLIANTITADKLNSNGATENFVLASKGDGTVGFVDVTEAVLNNAADISAGDGAISVIGGENATIQNVTIGINGLGITNDMLADRNIKADKMNAGGAEQGSVLTSVDGTEAKFTPMSTYAKNISTDASLEVISGNQAVLKEVTIKVKDGGILDTHIGAFQVPATKLNSMVNNKKQPENTVLTSDGDGKVIFKAFDNLVSKGNLTSNDASLDVAKGTGSMLTNVDLKINKNGVKNNHISPLAVSIDKLSSVGVDPNSVAVTDGDGALVYKDFAEISISTSSDMIVSNGLVFTTGSDGVKTVNSPVGIQIAPLGVTHDLLGNKAVIEGKIGDNAVTTIAIADNAVVNAKIASNTITSDKLDTQDANSGSLLVVDDSGNANFKELKSMMPKFFYLPSLVVDIAQGNPGTLNLYEEYKKQFSVPMASNPGAVNMPLPVLQAQELNYHVTYYDKNVFTAVSVSDAGILTYTVDPKAKVSSNSFMNFIIQVK